MKNYIGVIRDHSLSMQPLRFNAAKDYNSLIGEIKRGAIAEGFDTIVNVIECAAGPRADVKLVVANSSVIALQPMREDAYITEGRSTPLFESVGQMINTLKQTPDFNNNDVAFLVSAITDGEENDIRNWTAFTLREEMRKLTSTDRWTFTFRVPKGYYKRALINQFDIPEGNVLEWATTQEGLEIATQATAQGMQNYYSTLKTGARSTGSFFTDMSKVTKTQVQSSMRNISSEVQIHTVQPHQHLRNAKGAIEIQPFVEYVTGKPLIKGTAFYELVKPEKIVQGDKLFAFRDKASGAVYSSQIWNDGQARAMLGIPSTPGSISLKPFDHGDWKVYVQSKSVNRHLPVGSEVLVWYNAPQV